MLVSGSELSGQRRRQGAKMMASALGDMRFTSSSRATLRSEQQLGDGWEPPHRPPNMGPNPGAEPAENTRLGTGGGAPGRDPHPKASGSGHLLDQVEDEPLQGVVIGFWKVLQDGVDGSQLLLLLWQLDGTEEVTVLGESHEGLGQFPQPLLEHPGDGMYGEVLQLDGRGVFGESGQGW